MLLNQSMKRLLLIASTFLLWTFACKKDNTIHTIHTPVPFLTARLWTLDTILVNPPTTYNQLTPVQQREYDLALGWEKNAELTFNEDGTVTCGGNWDFAYYRWWLVNDGKDIEVLAGPTATKDTLFNWAADSHQFTYQRSLDPAFACTFVYH